jgi:hypothetical protein
MEDPFSMPIITSLMSTRFVWIIHIVIEDLVEL